MSVQLTYLNLRVHLFETLMWDYLMQDYWLLLCVRVFIMLSIQLFFNLSYFVYIYYGTVYFWLRTLK